MPWPRSLWKVLNYSIVSWFEMIISVLWIIYVYLEWFSLYIVSLVPISIAIANLVLSYLLKSKLNIEKIRKLVLVIAAFGMLIFSIYRFFYPEQIVFTNIVLSTFFMAFSMWVKVEFINAIKWYQNYFSSKIHSMTTFITRSIIILITFVIWLKYTILLPIVLVIFFFFLNYSDIKENLLVKRE